METTVVELDSDHAVRILEASKGRNVPLSPRLVARYRDDMVHGRWMFDGAPLRFSDTGRLLDGQHRLHALAEAGPGVVIRFLVVEGLPPEAQLVMDQGRHRTPGGQLSLFGQQHASFVAAAVKPFLRATAGRDVDVTTPAVVEFVTTNDVLVKALCDIQGSVRSCEMRPSTGGCLFMLAAQRDEAEAGKFFYALAHGGAPSGSAINALDQRLRRARRMGERLRDTDELGYGLTAWNLFRREEPVTRLQRPKAGAWTWDTLPRPL